MCAFYADMGGFVFNLEGIFYIEGYFRLALTARAVALLAECGLLLNLRKKDITDKSKTDRVAKLLSCLQKL